MSIYVENFEDINSIFKKHRLLRFFSVVLPDDHNFFVDYIRKLYELYEVENIRDKIESLNYANSKDIIRSVDYNNVNDCLKILIPIVLEDIESWVIEQFKEHPEFIERFYEVKNKCTSIINSLEYAYSGKAVYADEWNKRSIAILLYHVYVANFFLEYNVTTEIDVEYSISTYILEYSNTIELIESHTIDATSIFNTIYSLVDGISICSNDIVSTIIADANTTTYSKDIIATITQTNTVAIQSIDILSIVVSTVDRNIESITRLAIISLSLTKYVDVVDSYSIISLSFTKSIDVADSYSIVLVIHDEFVRSIDSGLSLSLINDEFVISLTKLVSISSIYTTNIASIEIYLNRIESISDASLESATITLFTPILEFDYFVTEFTSELSLFSSFDNFVDTRDTYHEIRAECDSALAIGAEAVVYSLLDTSIQTFDRIIQTISLHIDSFLDVVDTIQSVCSTIDVDVSIFDISQTLNSEIDLSTPFFDVLITVSTEIVRLIDSFDLIHSLTLTIDTSKQVFDVPTFVETLLDKNVVPLSLTNSIFLTKSTSTLSIYDYLQISSSVSKYVSSSDSNLAIVSDYETLISWYNSRYRFRRTIVITNSRNYALENVVIALIFDDEDFARKAIVGDVAFVLEDNATRLAHYRERDNYNGVSVFFVRIPRIDANSRLTLYLYYGTADYEDSSSEEVFDYKVSANEMTTFVHSDLVSARVYRY